MKNLQVINNAELIVTPNLLKPSTRSFKNKRRKLSNRMR